MKIEELDLSVRAYNVLRRARIETVEQLQQLSDDDLLRLRNMGVSTVKEIREKVAYVKTMTNADRIRAMSNDELEAFILYVTEEGWPFACQNQPECHNGAPAGLCEKCFKDWLRQPAKEEKPWLISV